MYDTILSTLKSMFDLCLGGDVVCNDQFLGGRRELIWLILRNDQICLMPCL